MAEDPSSVSIACCGVVCSDCGAYQRGRCKGCRSDKPMFRRCPVKTCVQFRQYTTCADCTPYRDLTQCTKLHNLISRIFSWLFGTDPIGNLYRIREVGLEAFQAAKRPKERT